MQAAAGRNGCIGNIRSRKAGLAISALQEFFKGKACIIQINGSPIVLILRTLTAPFRGNSRPSFNAIKQASIFKLAGDKDPHHYYYVNEVRPKQGLISGLLRWIFGKTRFLDLTVAGSVNPAMPLGKVKEMFVETAQSMGRSPLTSLELDHLALTQAVPYQPPVKSVRLVEGLFGRAFLKDAEGRKHRIELVV